MNYSLQLENVTKEYDNFRLDHISFNLKPGSIMGFIGENGSGKTTTIKTILNLINQNSGNIKILGLDNKKDELKIKEQIGVVFDDSHFHDTIHATDVNSIMSRMYKNWDSNLFYHYTDNFKLPRKKVIKEFSKGMKMKLSIAAALSHNPKLLILDEATSGLDPVVRNEILDVFLEFIQDEEHSILMSSHITSDLERISDYITFIHNGKIIFSDTKDDIIYNYAIIKCGIQEFNQISSSDIKGKRKNSFGYEILVDNKKDALRKYSNYTIDSASLEDIMLFYAKGDKACLV